MVARSARPAPLTFQNKTKRARAHPVLTLHLNDARARTLKAATTRTVDPRSTPLKKISEFYGTLNVYLQKEEKLLIKQI